jgi:hypothetical protein
MPQHLPGRSQQPSRLFLEPLEERCVLSGSFEGPFVPIGPPVPVAQAITTLIENIDQGIQRYSLASQDAVPSLTMSISLSASSGLGKTILVETVTDPFAPPLAELTSSMTKVLSPYSLFDNGLASIKVIAEITTAAPEEAAIDHAILQKLDLENDTLLSALKASTLHSFTSGIPSGDKELASALEPLGSEDPPPSDDEIAGRINAFFKDIADGFPDDLPGFDAQPPPPRPDRPDGGGFFVLPPPPLQPAVTCQHLSLDDCGLFHPEQLLQLARLGVEAAGPVNEVVKATSSLATVGDKLTVDWFGSLDAETSPLGTSHLIGLADFLVLPETSPPEVFFQAAPLLQGWLQAQGNLGDLDQAFRDFLNDVSQLHQEMRAWVCSHGTLTWALAGTALALTLFDQAQRWRRAQFLQQRLIQAIDQPHAFGDLIV